MKLFNLGLPKSGTTTMHKALEESGIKSAHWKFRKQTADGRPGTMGFVGRRMYADYLDGKDPLSSLQHYDAITQADVVKPPFSLWPQTDIALLKAVRARHPDCLFVLLTRDPKKIVSSMSRWKNMQGRLHALGAPGLPPDAAASMERLEQWVVDHFANMRAVFGDDPRFLEFDISDEDAADRLSAALDIEIKWWGVANVNTKNLDLETE